MLLRYYAAWSSLLSVVQWWCCTKLLHSPILSCLPACLPVRTPSNIQKKKPNSLRKGVSVSVLASSRLSSLALAVLQSPRRHHTTTAA
ncbi:hypothetical protein IWZ00DRAFT_139829 [Phyllosticta capitalensis]